MRRCVGAVLSGVIAAVLLVAVPGSARAELDGVPSVVSPVIGETHYRDYRGPFVVDFSAAPSGLYDYYVERYDDSQQVGRLLTYRYTAGDFPRPQLFVDALAPGAYRFRVDDHAGHQTAFAFVVQASAAPVCSILLPTKVRMTGRHVRIVARLSPTCRTLRRHYASWTVRHGGRFAETFSFFANATDSWTLYDDEPTGTYRTTPNSARDEDNLAIGQNSRSLVMKLDSRFALSARRTGGSVRLTARLQRYDPSANRYRAWSGRRVAVASRTCGTCAWHPVRATTTNRSGTAVVVVRNTRVRTYRVTAAGTRTIWAPVTRTVRR